ncbi:MAG: metal-sensitive transcriptional regulator [Elusimicrobia bacterium]|nr:metal-sensitive transcriptional regulator [Elusimicrobiota bacterium]
MATRRKGSPENTRTTLQNRLARMEGQMAALRRMIEGSTDWKKMLVLAAAIEGAVDQVTADLFEKYLESLNGGTKLGEDARKALDLVLRRL